MGKNLFYMFGDDSGNDGAHVVHVHFGMSGRFSTHGLPGPDVKSTTRLRLECPEHGLVAMLSAMTCDLIGDEAVFHERRAKLGQDPLRADADPDALWNRFRTLRKSVGLALMDQSMFAGVGNIYRAEILYKAGVHPEQPCEDLTRELFDEVWRHSIELLQRGFTTGSILTVDPEDARVMGEPWTRRYVYNQSTCGRCGGRVKTWDMASRKVYCCETCQPWLPGTSASEAAAGRVEMAKNHVGFKSHCAPDSISAAMATPERLTMAELRVALEARGWPGGRLKKSARKAELVAAFREVTRGDGKTEGTPVAMRPRIQPLPIPGIEGLEGKEATAAMAAAEKLAAGEKLNVEHIALTDDASSSLAASKKRGSISGARLGASATGPVTPDPAPSRTVRRRTSP